MLIAAGPAWAVAPTVRLIQPVGGQRGTEVIVTLTGQRLTDIQEILFYQPGITVTKIVGGKDAQAVATFKIAEGAQLGLHDFRVRTATGISSLKTFSVGTLRDVAEVEPNNDFARPQTVNFNVTVNGVAGNEDIDYYEVRAKKGERITAEVEGIRLGLTLFDPYVAILNAKRFELATSDDNALIWQDCFVSLVAPEDGPYIIAVREAAFAGNAQCLYRLHVGNFPRPTATLPSGGKVGDHLRIRWIGDVLGETTTEIDLPGHADRHFGLLAHDSRGDAPYPNLFRLSPFGNTIEAEPNDTHDRATPFVPPVALNGVIEKAGDVDFFTFHARKGQTYDIRVFARQIRSPLDPVIGLFAKNAGQVAGNDDSGGPDSYIRFNPPRDGDFVISVSDHLKKGGPEYTYRVEISSLTPRLELSTPNESLRRGTSVMALSMPKGNRQAILIQAKREDFSGAVTLSASNLPPGVTVEADEMTAGNTVIPVLFHADAKAPVGARFANVVGRPTDSSKQIPCEFSSTAELVLGQNNVPFWTRTVESLAVAVAEEAPFSVAIVEPKVPIVRGGSMDLKVVATRKPGFTAPILVSLPWNPPGIASKGEVVIPENGTEAVIPINANGGAELKTWRILANGTYIRASACPGGRYAQSTAAAARKPRRPAGGFVGIRPAHGGASVPDAQVPGGQRRARQGGRPDRERKQVNRLSRRSEANAHRPAQQGDHRAGHGHESRYQGRVSPQNRPEDARGRIERPVLPGGHHERRRADRAQPGDGPVAGRCAAPGQKADPAGRRRQARLGGHRQGRWQQASDTSGEAPSATQGDVLQAGEAPR